MFNYNSNLPRLDVHNGNILFNIHEVRLHPFWGDLVQKNTNGAFHWSKGLNLRQDEERPIHINMNHVCFSLIEPQLRKKVSLFYCASPLTKSAYSFAETIGKHFYENIFASRVGLDCF